MDVNRDTYRDCDHHYFSGCFTVAGKFLGACLKGAIKGHYERCSFRRSQPISKNTQHRQDYDEQIEDQLQESSDVRSSR